MEVDLSRAEDDAPAGTGAKAKGELVVDLTEHGQRSSCAKPDAAAWATAILPPPAADPAFAQPGEPGDEGNFLFELRIMAEVGLVGYPNAGKSPC